MTSAEKIQAIADYETVVGYFITVFENRENRHGYCVPWHLHKVPKNTTIDGPNEIDVAAVRLKNFLDSLPT